MTEKVVGTRMDGAVVERLEALAVLNDRTVSQLVREAVEAFLEAEEDRLRPFTASDITKVSAMLGMTNDELVSSAFLLRGIVPETAPISAVYLLVETEQRECYVGSSVAFRKRVASHLSGIRSRNHENSSLGNWSVDSTVVVVIAPVTREQIREVEQEWITRLKGSKEFTLTNERQSFDAVRRALPIRASKAPVHVVSNVPDTAGRVVTETEQQRHSETETAPLKPANELTKEESFHKQFIIGYLLPILEYERSSREVLEAVATAASYGTEEEKWAIAFIKQYDSPWLAKLAASGRFHAIAKLLS